jgi:hypothetical protein
MFSPTIEKNLFFSFFSGSQCVLTMFPLSSHQVPNMFPNMFHIATHFYPICFGKFWNLEFHPFGPTIL